MRADLEADLDRYSVLRGCILACCTNAEGRLRLQGLSGQQEHRPLLRQLVMHRSSYRLDDRWL